MEEGDGEFFDANSELGDKDRGEIESLLGDLKSDVAEHACLDTSWPFDTNGEPFDKSISGSCELSRAKHYTVMVQNFLKLMKSCYDVYTQNGNQLYNSKIMHFYPFKPFDDASNTLVKELPNLTVEARQGIIDRALAQLNESLNDDQVKLLIASHLGSDTTAMERLTKDILSVQEMQKTLQTAELGASSELQTKNQELLTQNNQLVQDNQKILAESTATLQKKEELEGQINHLKEDLEKATQKQLDITKFTENGVRNQIIALQNEVSNITQAKNIADIVEKLRGVKASAYAQEVLETLLQEEKERVTNTEAEVNNIKEEMKTHQDENRTVADLLQQMEKLVTTENENNLEEMQTLFDQIVSIVSKVQNTQLQAILHSIPVTETPAIDSAVIQGRNYITHLRTKINTIKAKEAANKAEHMQMLRTEITNLVEVASYLSGMFAMNENILRSVLDKYKEEEPVAATADILHKDVVYESVLNIDITDLKLDEQSEDSLVRIHAEVSDKVFKGFDELLRQVTGVQQMQQYLEKRFLETNRILDRINFLTDTIKPKIQTIVSVLNEVFANVNARYENKSTTGDVSKLQLNIAKLFEDIQNVMELIVPNTSAHTVETAQTLLDSIVQYFTTVLENLDNIPAFLQTYIVLLEEQKQQEEIAAEEQRRKQKVEAEEQNKRLAEAAEADARKVEEDRLRAEVEARKLEALKTLKTETLELIETVRNRQANHKILIAFINDAKNIWAKTQDRGTIEQFQIKAEISDIEFGQIIANVNNATDESTISAFRSKVEALQQEIFAKKEESSLNHAMKSRSMIEMDILDLFKNSEPRDNTVLKGIFKIDDASEDVKHLNNFVKQLEGIPTDLFTNLPENAKFVANINLREGFQVYKRLRDSRTALEVLDKKFVQLLQLALPQKDFDEEKPKLASLTLADVYTKTLLVMNQHVDRVIKEQLECTTMSTNKVIKDKCDKLEHYKAGLANQKDMSPENIIDLIDRHIHEIDSVFPVRVMINFRTKFTEGDTKYNVKSYDAKTKAQSADTVKTNSLSSENVKYLVGTERDDGYSFALVTNTFEPEGNIQNYGPFYKIVMNGNGINVENDMRTLFENAKTQPMHFLYSAYGYSGSGKSYTLLNNTAKKAVFNTILSEVKTQYDQKQNFTVQFVVYDLYGEMTVDSELSPKTYTPKKEKVTAFKYDGNSINHVTVLDKPKVEATDFGSFSENVKACAFTVPIEHDFTSKVANIYELINSYREKTNFSGDPIIQEPHIRATPNNPSSSRSHLFIDTYILSKEDEPKVLGKLTVMDMAGTEDVQKIKKDYYQTVNYPTISFKKSTIPPILQTNQIGSNGITFKNTQKSILKSELNNLSQFGAILTGVVNDIISTQLTIVPTRLDLDEINTSAWLSLFKHYLKINEAHVNDYIDIAYLCRFYNILHIKPKLIEYEKVLQEFTDYLRKFFIGSSPVDFSDTKAIKKQFRTYYFQTLEKELINSEKRTYFISNGKLNDKVEKAFDNVASTYAKQINESYTLIQDQITKLKSNLANETNVFNEFTSQYTSDAINSMLAINIDNINLQSELSFSGISQTYKTFLDNVKQKYHNPIARQGHYINHVLQSQLTQYAAELAKNPIADVKTNDVLTAVLMNYNIYDSNQLNKKFILLVNARLDFVDYTAQKYAIPEANKQDKHFSYFEALTLALRFAHCINPFSRLVIIKKFDKNGKLISETDVCNVSNQKGGALLAGGATMPALEMQQFFVFFAVVLFGLSLFLTEGMIAKGFIPDNHLGKILGFLATYTVSLTLLVISAGITYDQYWRHLGTLIVLSGLLYIPWSQSKQKQNIPLFLLVVWLIATWFAFMA